MEVVRITGVGREIDEELEDRLGWPIYGCGCGDPIHVYGEPAGPGKCYVVQSGWERLLPTVARVRTMSDQRSDVIVVGSGIAGRTAAIFTARHGYETTVLEAGGSLLRRNAHLENYPGFPAGVNPRLLLDMIRDQAEAAGARFVDAVATRVDPTDGGFQIETSLEETLQSSFVIAASKNATEYLAHLDAVEIIDRGKTYVATDDRGRTDVPGLYVAGRLAQRPHQAIVSAGHGAEVAVTLLEDDDRPFYHDWTAPTGYFTGRGRDVPPGVEEIDDTERRRRERESLDVMRSYFAEPHPDPVEQHPAVIEHD